MKEEKDKLTAYFANKDGFWCSLIYELLCTFSNKPSFFASKRIERFKMFNVFIWMIIGYVIRNWYELTVAEVIELSLLLIANGAWNTVQIRKDQKMQLNPTDNANQQQPN